MARAIFQTRFVRRFSKQKLEMEWEVPMSTWLKTPRRIKVVAFAILLPVWAGNVAAAEQRCNDLGTSCVCSEPLNTTTFAGGPDFWNPADSTTKQCSVEAASPGGAIVRTSNTIT